MIELRSVWKSYGEHVVLERLNQTVEEGEFITLVGTSGCGKSTFLKMLLGTEQPSRGVVLLDGKPIPEEPDQQRGIVFQQYSVFPHLTVLQNLLAAHGFSQGWASRFLWGKARHDALEKAYSMLESVGLSNAIKKYPHELSGGMKQRLAIAQTLMLKPRILLLDEPFGALDPGIRADMHKLVLNLWREHKLTIFMVTHDIKEGFYLGSRLWVFDKVHQDPQKLEAYGARITYDLPLGHMPRELYEEIDDNLRPRPVVSLGKNDA